MTVLVNSGLLRDALRLTRAGYRVFPVDVNGTPMFSRYHGVRPLSERELRLANWARAAFIGLALRPQFIVLDVDHKDGDKHGWDHLRWLEGAYGSLPTAPSQPTMSAGIHILLRLPSGIGEKTLGKEAVLPDNQPAHIDILRYTHRYARVHSVDMWLNLDWNSVPIIPDSWLRALVKPKRSRPRDATGSGQPSTLEGFPEALQRIVAAPEGSRNSTLSSTSFGLFLRGFTNEADVDAIQEAALRSGLPRAEVKGTLIHAWQAARRRFFPVAAWLSKVESTAVRQRARSATRIVALTVLLAERTLTVPEETWIALSARDAAEFVGVSAGTAHDYLTWLTSEGFIIRTGADQRGLAAMYRIVSNPNTCPPPQEKHVFDFQRPFGASHLRQQYRTELAVAPAFQRMGGALSHKPTLRPSALKVLIALESGAMAFKDLVAKTGLSASSVRRAVTELESCALVSIVDKRVTPEFSGDCEQALGEWSQFHKLEERNDVRRRRHDRERYLYGDYLLVKDGVLVKGVDKGRLRRLWRAPTSANRIRRDVLVRIERQRGRPVQAVLEAVEGHTRRTHERTSSYGT